MEGKNTLCTYREIMHLCQVNKIKQQVLVSLIFDIFSPLWLINSVTHGTRVRQGLHGLEMSLNIQGYLEKSLKIKFALKVLEFNHLQEGLTLFLETEISIKLWCLYLLQNMLHQIKAPQFYTNFLKLIS